MGGGRVGGERVRTMGGGRGAIERDGEEGNGNKEREGG